MADKLVTLPRLEGAQKHAAMPHEDIWLAASAGTGKTSVLAARVWRLLLTPCVRPDSILCLTFTRAGAAEMSGRVHKRLAAWAMMPQADLRKDLFNLGEETSDEVCARARTLFARVLEARGGGIRVLTIHAFCQTLLGTFPLEAGLAPGFRAIEGREASALAQSVLAEVATTAERDRDTATTDALRALSMRLGEDGARRFLLRAAASGEALDSLPSGLLPWVRGATGVPLAFDADHVPDLCCDAKIDRDAILDLARHHVEWGTATGEGFASIVSDWLLGTPQQRAAELHKLAAIWLTGKGEFRKGGPKHPDYRPLVERLHGWCQELRDLAARAALADDVAHALHAARVYARGYASAKASGGLVDFDDLIQRAAALLTTPGMGDWIAYKLDQSTDHILVDEAQDTNQSQWDIVEALVAEFWAGEGARGDALRTLFSVGDTKQAIFGFQGTDPRHYQAAGMRFAEAARQAERIIAQLTLDRSFRSSPAVLDVVDRVIAELGPEALGIEREVAHVSAHGLQGSVRLFAPVADPDGGDEGEEGWIPTATRDLATRLARQVRDWLDAPSMLACKKRPLEAGDVMILVRKRSDLAALLVARLQAEGVPVAGVDRLRLAAPLAVQDCVAAIRFATQPDDDLNLASLLVSPICGWTQEQLYAAAHVKRAGSLWRHLRDTLPTANLSIPYALLTIADFGSPFEFLTSMLSGPIGARRKLLVRLGNEASDPIDELLGAALDFEREGVATLQGFLDWFDRGEGEVVRDANAAGGTVRVMTVHAAKGLEAPLVILADAATDPDAGLDHDFEWQVDGGKLPLFRPRSDEQRLVSSIEASGIEAAERERREHWRLLYVAMTRAEEQLVIAGSLGAKKTAAPEQSWHSVVERALSGLGADRREDPRWGTIVGWGQLPVPGKRAVEADGAAVLDRPAWLDRAAPAEARPPRPLAPSSLGPDTLAKPPPSAELKAAAERGVRLHALFERLAPLPASQRVAAGQAWLLRQDVTDLSLVDEVIAIMDEARFAPLFGPGGLAEVPLAGVIDGVVVSGTADRIVVRDDEVDVIDFKTGRRAPTTFDTIPIAHLRQMSAYAAVLTQVFPDRPVRALLLYTAGPIMFDLPADLLERHKPRLTPAHELLAVDG